MTIFKSRPPESLISDIRQAMSSSLEDLTLVTKDGNVECSSTLISAISPTLQTLPNLPSIILLPDLTRRQISAFIQFLLSDSGPRTVTELHSFNEILRLLGENRCCLEIANFSSSEEEKDFSEDDFGPIESPPKRKKKAISEVMQRCFLAERNLYVCDICGIERKGSRSMQQHLSWHQRHPNEDYLTCHICRQCGKICAGYNAMKFHVRQVHCDRNLKCTYQGCERAFKTQVALKSHLDIHAGIKNYVCSECGFAFRSKQELKGHILRKHSQVKKTLPCEICGKLFRHMSNLKSHFNIHKAQSERQHRCQECNITFKSELTLKNHMVLHDPSRPFKCNKCPLRYKNKDAWVSHQSSHDNPQFSCQFCDVSYTRKDNLKRHMKDKHSKMLTKV